MQDDDLPAAMRELFEDEKEAELAMTALEEEEDEREPVLFVALDNGEDDVSTVVQQVAPREVHASIETRLDEGVRVSLGELDGLQQATSKKIR